MKALIGLASAVAGYLYIRRAHPGAAQKVEGRATRIIGGLTGPSDTRAEGRCDESPGIVRDAARQAR